MSAEAPDALVAHARPPEDALERLGADPSSGLAELEARARLERDGPNQIERARRRGLLRVLAAQFRDFMIGVLLVAAVVSGALGDERDAIAIVAIVVLNAVVGATQEVRAERAVEALRELAEASARVLRGGSWGEVPAAALVLGDIVALEAGDVVPADLRLVDAADLHVDESPLTGESVPVEKDACVLVEPDAALGDRAGSAHRGTRVTSGRGTGVVVATGMSTQIGRVAELLESTEATRTPLQRRLARFGLQLTIAVLALCALVFTAGIARGEPPVLMFLTAVSLAVAAIPEALPAVVTLSLALGARRMTDRNALVRHLPAVETLGSVTVICSDKTGTLTRNRMHVERLWTDGEERSELPRAAAEDGVWAHLGRALGLNNDAELAAHGGEAHGDPTELALLEAASSAGRDPVALRRAHPRLGEVAFDGERRRMTTLHPDGEGAIAYVKGAPEVVVPLCTGALRDRAVVGLDPERVLARAEELADAGHRVLAFAHRRLTTVPEPACGGALESDLVLLGLVALLDPPREAAAEAIATCRRAGIRPVMITGDHPGTARAIARRIGIEADEVITGPELDRLDPAERIERVGRTAVFARVSPEQKIAIVRALQERGELVAMTGDGVNDAPALERAEIGVAMGRSGTEVAREAADMTLLDDDFATIVAAVREGRRVFDNLRKFVKYTMTSNSGEIWTLSLAPLFGLPLPLLPVQILWINLVTDGLPGLALSAEPSEPGSMDRPPRPPEESLFAHGTWQHALWVGLLIAGLSIGAQAWAHGAGSERWQTVVFTVLTFGQLAHALGIRSEREPLLRRGARRGLALPGAVLLTLAMHLAIVYVPALQPVFHTSALGVVELLVCCALPLVVLAAVELEKLVLRRRERPRGGA